MPVNDPRYYQEIGVKIPQELNPLDWSIYYFCAPTDNEWTIAVRTAVRLLSRGRYWERDSRVGSIKAAQLVGREIEMSLSRCDMSEIADAIKYFADNFQSARITQTNNCGCGGGGGGGGGNTVLDEPIGQDESEPVDIVPPIPTADETGLTQQEKCSLANYLADAWVANWQDINTRWGGVAVTISAVQTWLTEKFPPGSIIPFVAMIISSLAVALEAALLANLADRMADAAAEQREDLVCAVYSANSAAEAKQNFESVIANTRATYGKIAYTVMILVAQMLDWNKIMGGEVIVPSDYDSADCSGCVPDGPEGFAYVPAQLVGVAGFGGTGVSSIVPSMPGGNTSRMTFVASSSGRTGRLDHEFSARPALEAGESWVGFGYTDQNTLNMAPSSWGYGWATDTADSFVITNGPAALTSGPGVIVKTGVGFPTTLPDRSVTLLTELDFSTIRLQLGLTGQSASAGDCQMDFSGFFWIKKLA